MIDIHDLEKRWLRYKIKSYIPHGIIVLSVLVIVVVASLTLNSTPSTEQPVAQKSKEVFKIASAEVEKKVQEHKPTATPQPKTQQIQEPKKQQNQMKLQPSLGFMKEMQQTSLPYYTENTQVPSTTEKILPDTTQKPTTVIQDVSAVEVEEMPEIVEEEPAHKVIIKKRDARHDIADVIKRFKTNQNPALSLFIAKQYYDLGDYKKAYNYALITNKINSEIEDSWLIFTKALVKLGEKKMAIKTLQEYIQNSDSQNAQILLEDIRSGKFR